MQHGLIICTFSIILSLFTTKAQDWTQIGNNIYGEFEYDHFGTSVCLSSDGSIVAIGSFTVTQNETSGVSVYQNITGEWQLKGNIIIGDELGDWFGYCISLNSDGSIVAVSAPHSNGNGTNSGKVQIFQDISGTWTQLGNDIYGEYPEDESGFIVDLNSDGSIVAIGAYRNSENGFNAGHVRIFQLISGVWTQLGDDIDGEAFDDKCGYSVCLNADGNIIAVSSVGYGDNDQGCVRIFRNESGVWTQLGNSIDGLADDDILGYSVGLSDDGYKIAIGAPSFDTLSTGYVKAYQYSNGSWIQVGNNINGQFAGDRFGRALSLNSDGSIVAIAAANFGVGSSIAGDLVMYKNDDGSWTQLGSKILGSGMGFWHSNTSVSIASDGKIVANGSPCDYVETCVRIFNIDINEVEELNIPRIRIYPNPTSGIIILENLDNDKLQLKISDISGKVILGKTIYKHIESIDISSFNIDTYIVSLKTKYNLITTKIIKQQ